MEMQTVAIIVALVTTVFAAFGQYLFKLGANQIERIFPNPFKAINKYLVWAVIIYVSAAVLTLSTLRYAKLSVIYPLGATTFVWVIIIAKIKLKEKINMWKILGV